MNCMAAIKEIISHKFIEGHQRFGDGPQSKFTKKPATIYLHDNKAVLVR